MYDEVVNAAKGVLLTQLELPCDDLQRIEVLGLAYSRDPDYWQVCLRVRGVVPGDATEPYVVILQRHQRPSVVRGSLPT